MNTQTHLLVAAALLTRPDRPARNAAVIAGALVPDLAIYTLFVWSKVAGIPEMTVWRELYFSPPWQDAVIIGNSAPLYGAILLAGAVLAGYPARAAAATPVGRAPARPVGFDGPARLAVFFALAALTHLAGDLPVHVDDAHAHFWPLSLWRFRSPVSYWDPHHNGDVFAVVEAALGLVLAVILWRRFAALWVRALLVLAMIAFVAPPIYFGLMLGA